MRFDFGKRRIFLCVEPVDMRCGAERLAQAAVSRMGLSPIDGAAFLFTGSRRNILKILVWDGNGFWLLSKRLYRGTFAWPADGESARREIGAEDVDALLEGQDRWRRIGAADGSEI
jgi:transposase